MLHFLKQYLNAFVDYVYWCGLLLEKKACIWVFSFNEFFLSCRVPAFRGQKVVNMAVTRVSRSCLLTELGPICNSMTASLCFKSCEDHNLLTIYNGGQWENIYRSGSKEEYQTCFVGYLGCWGLVPKPSLCSSI